MNKLTAPIQRAITFGLQMFANVINYAERFENIIEEIYKAESFTSDWEEASNDYPFIDAQTIKVADLAVSGYRDHKRDGTQNTGSVTNTWTPYKLDHDRDVKIPVDEADIDESNHVVSVINIAKKFLRFRDIPETDKYRHSKVYSDFVANGGTPNTTAITAANILDIIDTMSMEMDEAEVPMDGRTLRLTPALYKMLKEAEGIARTLDVRDGQTRVNRDISFLEDLKIKKVPSIYMKTAYDFTTDDVVPGATAKQINLMLTHNRAVITKTKIADIYLWAKGSDVETAFGPMFQTRKYQGCWVITKKVKGVAMNVDA